ncbi:AI-2E family transporter [Chryseobacterium sp. Ch-15]|uniref:AI-2E family transporter n=1 Tax=Chryseobacterium muglaense TaxID=2893752 RepID=A0A9Q3YW70_9FLAO|nr:MULTISPECIES: AI-2E family transporter [Chryseobacterium]MBD3904259.1 AI-2E family transporter [Chryseobacterium muglaense]MBO6186332.1 AI-2E family transporter [Chryseobacterium sp.]MCC9035425.1 AI-2E family transporter [Chryseobacterium muglaense]MCM2553910.1 AI-2E family transporter [Chryseobacterium muglaense]
MNFFKLTFLPKLALAVISIIGIGYLIKLGQSILAPFFLAFLMAMLFLPLADFMERKLKFPRSFSTIASVMIMLTILTGMLYFFGSQLSSFSKDLPHLSKQFNLVFHNLQNWVSQTFNVKIDEQFDYLDQGLAKLLSSSGVILGFTFGVFSTSLGFLAFFILFFVFILNYRRILNNFIVNVFNEKHKASVQEVVSEVRIMTKRYIIGLCIQVIIVSVLTTTVLTILGVKYAILLGVLTGLLNVIPYIGIAISLLISCFIAFATGTVSTCVYVAIGYVIVHAIDGNIILPFVVGSKVKINALFSFIGILLGEHLWGISGMFLCIPAIAIIKIIFERVDGLKPWGKLLGEEEKPHKKKKSYKISKNITLKEMD